MTFTVEKITSDSDLALFNSFGFVSPYSGPVSPSQWAIDREREAVLVLLGGAGARNSERPLMYALGYRGQAILAAGYITMEGNPDDKWDFHWEIDRLLVPNTLALVVDECIGLLREALVAAGNAFTYDLVRSVHIDAIAQPTFVEGK